MCPKSTYKKHWNIATVSKWLSEPTLRKASKNSTVAIHQFSNCVDANAPPKTEVQHDSHGNPQRVVFFSEFPVSF